MSGPLKGSEHVDYGAVPPLVRKHAAEALPVTEQPPAAGSSRRARNTAQRRWAHVSSSALLYAALTAGCLVLLLPILWMVATSLKATDRVFEYPPRLLPDPVVWSNYARAIGTFPFWLYLRNSLVVASIATFGTVLSSSLVAFGFARRRFPERGVLFALLLSTMMLPGIVTLIPTFVLFTRLQWVNTFLPLTVPAFFGSNAFNIFLLRQFYLTLPYEYDESAYLDGASSPWVWWKIIVPLSKAPLIVVGVFTFLFHWNDFMGPLIYMNSPEMRTLAVGLQFFREQYNTQWTHLMAGATLMTIPVLVLFFAAQRYFLQGILMTGLSGR